MADLSSLTTTNERLCEEFEFLQNVYTSDEVVISEQKGDEEEINVVMTVHAATAGETDRQYVCLMLNVCLPSQYPDESPTLEIRNPRGLSEQEVLRLEESLQEYIRDEKGSPVLMQIFEMARGTLTDTNIPDGVCSICLSDFKQGELLKTDCYHYFHVTCMYKYKTHWLKEMALRPQENLPAYLESPDIEFVCPECRKPIQIPDDVPVHTEDDTNNFTYMVSREMREQQKEWQRLYKRQLEAGGIIDVEKERDKHRLPPPTVSSEVKATETDNPSDTNTVSSLESLSLADGGSGESTPHSTDDRSTQNRGGSTHVPHSNRHSHSGYRHSRGHHNGRHYGNRYNHPRHERPNTGDSHKSQQSRHKPTPRPKSSELSAATGEVSGNNTDQSARLPSAKSDKSTNELSETNSKNSVGSANKKQIENSRGRYRRPYGHRYRPAVSAGESAEQKHPRSDEYKKADNANNSELVAADTSLSCGSGADHSDKVKNAPRKYNNFQQPHKYVRRHVGYSCDGRLADSSQRSSNTEHSTNAQHSSNMEHSTNGEPTNGSAKAISSQDIASSNTYSSDRGSSTRGRGSTRGRHRGHWRGPQRNVAHGQQRGDNFNKPEAHKQSTS